MPQKNDASLDLMARQLGTHIIRNPALLWEYQADVTQLIAHSEVAFAAVLSDGTIILRCPGGLPDDLAAVAEPFKPLPAPQPAPVLEDNLARLERKLDQMIADQTGREQIADRLDAIEFAMQDRAAPPEEDTPTPAETAALLQLLIEKLDAVALQVQRKVEPALLAQTIDTLEERLKAAFPPPAAPDLSSLLMAVDAVAAQIATAFVAPAARVESLLAKVDDLANRPEPTIDLTAQHQAFTRFLISVGSATARLEETADVLSQLQDKGHTPELTEISSALQSLATRIEAGPDWSPLFLRLGALQQGMIQSLQDSSHAKALSGLTDQIARLAQQPAPVLDLTAQHQSLAEFGTTISRAMDRLELVSEAMDARGQSDAAAPQSDILTVLCTRVDEWAESTAAMLQDVVERIIAFDQRPVPVLDLIAQHQSFAAIGNGLSEAIERLDLVSAALETRIETAPQPYTVTGLSDWVEAWSETMATTLQHLDRQMSALGQRPDPAPDLTAQRQSLAALSQSLLHVDARLEAVSEILETQRTPPPELAERLARIESGLAIKGGQEEARRDSLVDAMLQLAAHVSRQPARMDEAVETHMTLLRIAQDELLQDLRFAFAELIATQLRAQSLAA